MLTHEQYKWLKFIESGECTIAHREEHAPLFNELFRRNLITNKGNRYQITEQGKLEVQESLRLRRSDIMSIVALCISIFSFVTSVVLGIIGVMG